MPSSPPQPPTSGQKFNTWIKSSVTLKMVLVGFIILLLMIPASLVDDLIRERRNLRDSVQDEVASKYGREQIFGGPVISVPYSYDVTKIVIVNDKERPNTTTFSGYAHFLPNEIFIDGEVLPEEKSRGIFVAVLYKAKFTVRGVFEGFNEEVLGIPEGSLKWEDALFTVGISDMTGVDAAIMLDLNGETYNLGPGTVTKDVFTSGASVPVDLSDQLDNVTFDFAMDLNGSSGLYFRPFGVITTVDLKSTWPDPSFTGGFLPQASDVTEEGFTTTWEVLQLNRNYPQQGKGSYLPKLGNGQFRYNRGSGELIGYDDDRFGVRLLLPVDEYSKIYRSTNYALLFIIITFMTFFFIEVLSSRRVHPVQYILIGAAIILFYVLLLSISEHKHFDFAYWVAAVVITTLITAYSAAVLRNAKLTALVAGTLITLYVYFYSLLQLQDFALLIGSIGLLIILAIIMYLTRNIDWYNINRDDSPPPVRSAPDPRPPRSLPPDTPRPNP